MKTARKSVPLTDDELQVLDELRDADTERAAALRELAQLDREDTSEASVLHALLALGLRRVSELADERAYVELARSYSDDPDEAGYRDAARSHRRRSTTRWSNDT